MSNPVIVDAVRTPMGRGKPGGALSSIHPVDLLRVPVTALIERNRLDPAVVDDLIIGCVSQVGEQSSTPGRQAWLGAGYPVQVPSTTVERKCGSSQQAIDFAAWGIAAGAYDVVIAGGVESMSRVPMGTSRMNADPFGDAVRQRFPDLSPQGIAAELIARKWKLRREDVDAYAAESHRRAASCRRSGAFADEIVSVRTESAVVTEDETIREGTTVEKLGTLPVAFRSDVYTDRFGTLDWVITAGNSSQLTDGASALLLMSESRAREMGLTPRARIVASAVCGDDPTMMLTGPIPATIKVCERARLSVHDMDAIEVNEAFASVPLAWQAEFNYDPAKLNPCGGAIALGHPLGASGARLMTTLISHLERTGGRYGLQTMCEAGGMANATIIEMI
jgi:acetyl-CoA acyltransferase